MKDLHFNLDKWQCEKFIEPVRTKMDIINLWMFAIKIIMTYGELNDSNIFGQLILSKKSMNRLFFQSNNKCFSLNFPFNYHSEKDFFLFNTYTTIEIGSKESSAIISILQTREIMEHNDGLAFLDKMYDYVEAAPDIWSLLRYLMMQEDGYIRHDHDPQNKNGMTHPMNHIDVCYSNSATFKLGIDDKPHFAILRDILDCETNCHFLKKITG